MKKLGKNQEALLLIVDQSTRYVGADKAGMVFVFEESITYTRADGEVDTFFMMTRDLKSLDSLANRGLIKRHKSGYSEFFTITEDGRIIVEELRGKNDPSYRF